MTQIEAITGNLGIEGVAKLVIETDPATGNTKVEWTPADLEAGTVGEPQSAEISGADLAAAMGMEGEPGSQETA